MNKGEQLNELALFAGAGGGILGGHLLGWRTVAAVEIEDYPRRVLLQRQADGILPRFPIWDDVQTFDGGPWRGKVDVISGGFPCQDISCAGKGAGIDGERSSMWTHMARIIGEVRPRFVLVENSPMLVGRGLARVLGDLAEMGYNAEWGIVGAVNAGAPHKRDRIWLISTHAMQQGESQPRADKADEKTGGCRHDAKRRSGGDDRREFGTCSHEEVADPISERGCSREARVEDAEDARESSRCERGLHWWDTEPNVGRVAHGVAARVDRLKAIGNGQVPAVAELAWEILNKES